jgi:ABC-type transport system involved in multi-copper enzyme maturation permease subunit
MPNMAAHLRQSVISAIRLGWLTGPIFDKELRVSSRRRRNYVLRFAYILLLTVFIGLVWLSTGLVGGNAAFARASMEIAAKQIVVGISVFQFIAMQLLAIIMLSAAISDEVYHRTLGLLMTTPISGLQIVMGKLLSKLLQLVLLLGLSLPVLAIVRVLGGVPWEYLLSSLLMTLTTAIFAGSLTLLFSIKARRAYTVIIRSAFVLAVLYFFVPAFAGAMWQSVLPRFGVHIEPGSLFFKAAAFVLFHANPFYGIWATTNAMVSPGGGIRFLWPLHCAMMLGLSALVIAWSVAIVRKVALWQATGQLIERETGLATLAADSGASHSRRGESPSRRVRGPAVVWRELRAPFIQGVDDKNSRIGLAVTVLALLLTYLASHVQGYLDDDFTHVSYGLLFVFMGLVFNAVFSATRITTEKESQTWVLLLATSLSDYDILMGKAVSAFRRCLPIWALLAAHVVFFTLAGYIHPVALVHLLLIVAWVTCFVTGAGLYFSARFRHTTAAVVASFALMLGLWAVGPIVAGIVSLATKSESLFVDTMLANPMVQTELVVAGAAGTRHAGLALSSLEYGAEHVFFNGTHGMFSLGQMTNILLVTAGLYVLAGLLFFWLAKRRLRRNVF